MKKHRAAFIPLFAVSSILVLIVLILLGAAYWMAGYSDRSLGSSMEMQAPIPTITSIPLPDTVEEVIAECPNGECVDVCLMQASNQIDQHHISSFDYVSEDVDLTYYGIDDHEQLEKPRNLQIPAALLPYQQNERAHQIIWSYFKTIVPSESRPDLVNFGIYISSTSDGKFDTTLYRNWIVKFNILALEDIGFLTNAIVHEHGHYLTLNRSQVDSSNICRQEGLYFCEAADSYLYLFFLDFWEGIYPEWKDIDWQSDRYEQELDSFYQKYKDRFLNDYAATDPIEDIAESWTAFVLKPRPLGDTIAEQKIIFFYEFPELVQLRYEMIKGICTFGQTR